MNQYGKALKLSRHDLLLLCEGLAKGLGHIQTRGYCLGMIRNFCFEFIPRDERVRITEAQFSCLKGILKETLDYDLHLTGKPGYDRYPGNRLTQIETFFWTYDVKLAELFPEQFPASISQIAPQEEPEEEDPIGAVNMKSLEFRVRQIERLLQELLED